MIRARSPAGRSAHPGLAAALPSTREAREPTREPAKAATGDAGERDTNKTSTGWLWSAPIISNRAYTIFYGGNHEG